MLSKEQFCKYAKAYKAFQKYVDMLDELYVKIWEASEFCWYNDCYVTLVCDLLGCEPDEKNGTVVENFLFDSDYTEEDTEEFYDNFVKDNYSDSIEVPMVELGSDTLLQLMMVAKDISPDIIQRTFDLKEPFTKIVFNHKMIFSYNNETKKWEFIERG